MQVANKILANKVVRLKATDKIRISILVYLNNCLVGNISHVWSSSYNSWQSKHYSTSLGCVPKHITYVVLIRLVCRIVGYVGLKITFLFVLTFPFSDDVQILTFFYFFLLLSLFHIVSCTNLKKGKIAWKKKFEIKSGKINRTR